MFIEEVSMAKRIKKEKSVIVLNAMYSGKYLNDNMGHEIINLFKTTNSIKIGDVDYHNFIYLNPYGNFNNEYVGAVKDMLMVISVPKKNMFEVVAKATGLVDVFKPVKGFNPTLKGTKTESQLKAEAEVNNDQVDLIGDLIYGDINEGVKLTSLFKDDKQQAVFVTYAAAEVRRPKKRLFIAFDKGGKNSFDETDMRVEVTLTSQDIGRQPQKQYFDRLDEGEQNDAELLDKLLNGDYWLSTEESTSTVSKGEVCELRKDSLINICRIEDNELAFSNALAFYIQRYPHFYAGLLGFDKDNFSIEREWNHIDIYIKSGDKRIIVENKIHSGINYNQADKDYNAKITKGDKEQSQLYRYWESAKEDVGETNEENISGFLLCPEYKLADLGSEKSSKIFGENYTIISYSKIYNALRNTPEYNEDGNYNFRDFVDALYKHSFDSVPKVKYIEMRDQFITRINNA
jgi:hypothetical protein